MVLAACLASFSALIEVQALCTPQTWHQTSIYVGKAVAAHVAVHAEMSFCTTLVPVMWVYTSVSNQEITEMQQKDRRAKHQKGRNINCIYNKRKQTRKPNSASWCELHIVRHKGLSKDLLGQLFSQPYVGQPF